MARIPYPLVETPEQFTNLVNSDADRINDKIFDFLIQHRFIDPNHPQLCDNGHPMT